LAFSKIKIKENTQKKVFCSDVMALSSKKKKKKKPEYLNELELCVAGGT